MAGCALDSYHGITTPLVSYTLATDMPSCGVSHDHAGYKANTPVDMGIYHSRLCVRGYALEERCGPTAVTSFKD